MNHDYPFLIRNAGDAGFIAHVQRLIDENIDNFIPNGADPEHRKFWSFSAHDVDPVIAGKKLELIERFGIVDWVDDPRFHDFIGMISEGGAVHPHTDPSAPGRIHVRINLLVRAPEGGCVPILDDIPIDVRLGDAWLCLSGHSRHATTSVVGRTPRSAISYGLQVARHAGLAIITKYTAWKSAAASLLPLAP